MTRAKDNMRYHIVKRLKRIGNKRVWGDSCGTAMCTKGGGIVEYYKYTGTELLDNNSYLSGNNGFSDHILILWNASVYNILIIKSVIKLVVIMHHDVNRE